MGRKKRKLADQLWCYYCDKEFEEEKILTMHQQSKHFKCHVCEKKLLTLPSLLTHLDQLHHEKLTSVPNAIPGRDSLSVKVVGMKGIPEDIRQEHMTKFINVNTGEIQYSYSSGGGNTVPTPSQPPLPSGTTPSSNPPVPSSSSAPLPPQPPPPPVSPSSASVTAPLPPQPPPPTNNPALPPSTNQPPPPPLPTQPHSNVSTYPMMYNPYAPAQPPVTSISTIQPPIVNQQYTTYPGIPVPPVYNAKMPINPNEIRYNPILAAENHPKAALDSMKQGEILIYSDYMTSMEERKAQLPQYRST